MTKAEMIIQADKLDIANKDDLFDAILAGRMTETMFLELQVNDLIRKQGEMKCQTESLA